MVKVVAFSTEPEVWTYINTPGFVRTDFETSCQWVSNLGRLLRNNLEIVDYLNGTLSQSGYQEVRMCNRTLRVHQVVCYTFHGPPPKAHDDNWEYFTVDHINRRKEDNSAANLRWGSMQLQQANKTKANSEELVTVRKEASDRRKRVKYGQSVTYLRYLDFVNTSKTIEEIASEAGVGVPTVQGNLVTNFDSCHSEIFLNKLGLTLPIVKSAFEIKQAVQLITKNNTDEKAATYSNDIYEALGPDCKNVAVATQLLSKLHEKYFR